MKYTALIVVFLVTNIAFSQKLMEKSNVKTQKFGKEIYYKDYRSNDLLDGYYKIADSRGNYVDTNFKQGKKHGKNTEYDYKGRKLSEVNFVDGKADGKYTAFHQNGKIQRHGKFDNGKLIGKWEYFNFKGEIIKYEHYKNGQKHGKTWVKVYRMQKESELVENYKDDKRFGHSQEKEIDGNLIWEREYADDITYSEKKYHPNGKLGQQKKMVDGKLEGDFITYNQDGIMVDKKEFVKDFLIKHITYYENGRKDEERNYKNGKFQGVYERYTDEGVKIEEGKFENDVRVGIWKKYNRKTKRLETETTYRNDVKNGIFKEYNEAERIAEQGNYKNNEKDGVWKYYNLAGKLEKEITYDLGREITVKTYKNE